MFDDKVVYYWLALAWSLTFTAVLLFVRSRVRTTRQRTIDELRLLFFPDRRSSTASFDYVRAKYEMCAHCEQQDGAEIARPVTLVELIVASIPYVVLCALGFLVLFVPKSQLLAGTYGPPMLTDNMFWVMARSGTSDRLLEAAAVFSAAFLGGYLMTARVLLRAVQNYELTQLTFLQSAAHLAFGLVSGMMLYHILRPTGIEGLLGGDKVEVFPGFLLLAFMGGYMPDLGLINLSRRLHVKYLKTVDSQSLNATAIQPPEMLDGIDYDIRYRLEQAGYYDVQNLATANPLLIYVETPYGLYQAFDWVVQAQLCVATGPEAFRALRACRIRTSLDLERAVLGDDATDEFVVSVGRILFPPAAGADPLGANSVRHGVMMMLDDLHIHRVRALWQHIFVQITGETKRHWIYRSVPGLGFAKKAAAPAPAAPAAATPPIIVEQIGPDEPGDKPDTPEAPDEKS